MEDYFDATPCNILLKLFTFIYYNIKFKNKKSSVYDLIAPHFSWNFETESN